jgi:hypothetical protein
VIVRSIVAALVALVLAGSVAALLIRRAAVEPATGVMNAPTVIEVYRPDASVSVADVNPGSVQAFVYMPGLDAELDAFAAGLTPAADVAAWRSRGTVTTVNGRPGFYVVGAYPSSLAIFKAPPTPTPTLAWEYADHAWAFLGGCDQCSNPKAALLRAAALVRFGRATPVNTPIRLGYVPAGFTLGHFDRVGVEGNGPHFTRADQPYQVFLTLTDGGSGQIVVSAAPADGTDWGDGWNQQFRAEETINGHAVYWAGSNEPRSAIASALVDFGTCQVQVNAGTHDQAIQIIRGISTADCTRPAKWWDARTVGVATSPLIDFRMPVWLPSQ